MKAIVVVDHSLQPRVVRKVRGKGRKLSHYCPRTNLPTICALNGRYISRSEWRWRKLRDNDVLSFHVLPQGGGGDESKVLRTVATLAVLYFTAGTGAPVAGALFGAGATAGQIYVTQAAITIGALALVNAVLPPPKLPSQDYKSPSFSPTYSIGSQGNSARLGQAIPSQYGRHICYPDYAAEPYAEFVGNEQYLYQLFCVGQGYYSIDPSEMRLDDTSISVYTDVAYEIVPPGGSVTLFPSNVVNSVAVTGIEVVGRLQSNVTATRSGKTLTITETAHGRANGSIVTIGTDGISLRIPNSNPERPDVSFTVDEGASYSITSVLDINRYQILVAQLPTSGGGSGSGKVVRDSTIVGPYVASSSGLQANKIGIDVVCPRGLFRYNSSGKIRPRTVSFVVQARRINDSGAPLADWFVLGSESITAATATAQRSSFTYDVPLARYEVRMYRTDVQDTDATSAHEMAWSGLKSYIPSSQSFADVTLIALRLKATSELSQAASRKFNLVSTRMLPVYNGTSWSAPVATRSIAWALADVCRNSVYGGGIADNRIDIETLLEYDAIWSARGDTFDARFDSTVTLWEALQRVARAGRAKAYMQGGVVRFWRDQEQNVAVGMFTPRNSIPNSLSISYLPPTEETADAVEVEYFSEETWASDTVVASLPGSSEDSPVKVQLFGVTNRNQAWREGMYMAACNRYRRRLITRSTEMEGLIPSIGDMVLHADKRLTNAQSGEAVGWSAGTLTLRTSEPLTWSSGDHYVNLRRRNGGVDGPYRVTQGADDHEMVFDTTPAITPYVGSREERTFYSFGTETESRLRAIVTGLAPSGNTVEIRCVAEYYDGDGVPYVHYADTGAVPAPIEAWQLPRLFSTPSQVAGIQISDRLILLGTLVRTQMIVSWDADANAEGYRVAWRQGTANWNQMPDTIDTSAFVVDVIEDTIEVRVVAFAGARESAPAYATGIIVGKSAPPSDVTDLTINGDVLSWIPVPDLDIAGYQMRFNYGTNIFWDTAAKLHDGLLISTPFALSTRPSGLVTFLIKAIDTSGNESAQARTLVTQVSEALTSNIVFSQDEQPDFSGTKTYCEVDGGVLEALDLESFFYPENEGAFEPAYEAAFGPADYAEAIYEWTFAIPFDGTVLLRYTIEAEKFKIEYQIGDQSAAFLPSGDFAFDPADDLFFGQPSDWTVWPGSLTIGGPQAIRFRITLGGGRTQGRILELTSILDVPDVIEDFNDFVVAPGGSRLPLTKQYREILNVKLTLQADGGAGRGVQFLDKDAENGPLVQVINSSGTSVAGTLDATIQGY